MMSESQVVVRGDATWPTHAEGTGSFPLCFDISLMMMVNYYVVASPSDVVQALPSQTVMSAAE